VPGIDIPSPFRCIDVGLVFASDAGEGRDALRMMDDMAPSWPRPMLNPPHLVCNLDRDKLHHLLSGIEGLDIPATLWATRAQLSDMPTSDLSLSEFAAELQFPAIVRPRGSHAGVGLAKLDDAAA